MNPLCWSPHSSYSISKKEEEEEKKSAPFSPYITTLDSVYYSILCCEGRT